VYYLPGPVSATDLEIMRRPESQEVLRASNIGSPVTVSGATSAPGRAYLHACTLRAGFVAKLCR
jgi:septum formation inhibitor-activating ATPase MinD